MRALSVSLLALLVASPAIAKDYLVYAPATQATVHPDGAKVLYSADLTVDAGTHNIKVVFPGDLFDDSTRIDILGAGLTRGPFTIERALIDTDALLTPIQAAAMVRAEAAKRTQRAAADAIQSAQTEIDAFDAQITYLKALGQPDEADAESLIAISRAVSAEIAAAQTQKIAINARLVDLRDAKDQADLAAATAQQAFLDTMPFHSEYDPLAVTVQVTLEAPGPVRVDVEDRTREANWGMTYDMALNTEAGTLDVKRKVIVGQRTDLGWKDVDLTLATNALFAELAPRPTYPNMASIETLFAKSRVASAPYEMKDEREMGDLMEPAPMVEAVSVAAPNLIANSSGPVVTFAYPKPVSLQSDKSVVLDLDQLLLEADPMIHASPRYDDTAFMLAEITNTSGSPLLPGTANISRDGAFMGSTQIGRIPAGAADKIGFGPVEGIRLETIFVRNETGDIGLISKSSTREQKILFTLENLTDAAQSVTAFYALPHSEQEDLRIQTTATPRPNAIDVDDKRGVASWDVNLAPGEKKQIALDVEMNWPEGSLLNWAP